MRRLGVLLVVIGLVAAACSGSGGTSDEVVDDPGSAVATTNAAAPGRPTTEGTAPPSSDAPSAVEATSRVEPLAWESLNGPPGGNVRLFVQDTVRPEHLYLTTGRGLHRSVDRGERWELLAEELTRDTTAIAFGRDAAYACTAVALLRVDPDGSVAPVGDACTAIAIDDGHLYTSTWWEGFEAEFALRRAELADGAEWPEPIDWQDITPPAPELSSLASGPPYVLVDDLLVVDDALILSLKVAVDPHEVNAEASAVFRSETAGDSWEPVDPGFGEPLLTQRLVHDPSSGMVFALAHVHQTDGPGAALAELVRVSRDGGATWAPLTTVSDIGSTTVGDVDVLDDRYVLSLVGFSMVELDRDDPNRVLRSHHRPEVTGRSVGYTIEELIFDPTAADTIYARPYLGHEGAARSTDGGDTWHAIGLGISSAPTGNINVHPADPDVMIASGNLGYAPHLTRDGGDTWTALIDAANLADEVAFDPHDPLHVVLMSEGSVFYESFDGGETWTIDPDGFGGFRIYDLALSTDRDRLFASNLGINISNIEGVAPGGAPPGFGENLWFNMLASPDYAYALAAAPDGALFTTQSPRKFEDHASVWRYRGPPDGDPEGWEEVLRVEGATGMTDLAIAPGAPYTIHAGSAGRDATVWTSDDGGMSWTPAHDDSFTFVTVHAVAIDPSQPDVVYAAPWGAGLFRSEDRGSTWTELEVPTVSVAAIVVDPADGDHLVIGDRTRPIVWESVDGGDSWFPRVEFDPDAHYRVMALGLGPGGFDGGLYVSLLDRSEQGLTIFAGGPNSGTTFRIRDDEVHPVAGLDRSVLAFAAADDEVYAVGHVSGVYEIVADVATDISAGLPDMGFNHLSVHGEDVIVAGGSDIGPRFESRIGDPGVVNNLYRWTGAGRWEPLLEGDPFDGPIKVLVRHPSRPDHLYAATATGVYRSADGGATWTDENGGLAFTSIGAFAIAEDHVVAGTLGGGTVVGDLDADGAISWRPASGPDVEIANVRLATHPSDRDRVWASSYPGGVFRSVDGGRTWIESNFGLPSFEVTDPLLEGYYALAVDPVDPETVYLSVVRHGVFVSDDGAATWRPIGVYGESADLMRAALTDLVVDGADGDRLWLATHDRGVFTSPDRGGTWVEMNDGLPTTQILTLESSPDGVLFAGTDGYGVFMLEPGGTEWSQLGRSIGTGAWATWDRRLYQYGALLFDPTEADRVYLGHFPGGFFVSDDGGRTWMSSNLGVGNDGMFSLTMHPDDPDVFFAGTYNGILRSDDRGRTWYDSSEGMPAEQWPFAVVIDEDDPAVMYTTTKNGQNKGFCERNQDTFCGTVMRSRDGGASWAPITEGLPSLAEYYMLELDPRDHRVLYLSSSRGVFVSDDRGETWTLMNDGLPEIGEFYIRDNVAHNMELSRDDQSLVLTIVGYGVWKADLPALQG